MEQYFAAVLSTCQYSIINEGNGKVIRMGENNTYEVYKSSEAKTPLREFSAEDDNDEIIDAIEFFESNS